MRTQSTCLALAIIMVCPFASGQWLQQNSGTTKNLYGVSFTDANTGTVVGDSGAILRTTMAAQQPALDAGTFVRYGRRTFKEGNIWERNQKIHS
jgi:hypothetical protein